MRLSWLDNAKMVAMLCVIIGHIVSWFADGKPDTVSGLIVAFNMPLFVLLSGYTSLSGFLNLKSFGSLVEYGEKVLWRMVIPSVFLSAVEQAWSSGLFGRKLWLVFFCGILAHWLIMHREWKFVSVLRTLLVRTLIVGTLLASSLWLNMYWFLSMLLKLQIIMAIFCYLGNERVQPAILIPVTGIFLWIGSFFFLDSWTSELSFYFMSGMVLKHSGGFEYICHLSLPLAMVFAVIGVLICYNFTIDYDFYSFGLEQLLSEGSGWVYPLRLAAALFLCFAMIRMIFSLSKDYGWFSKMGRFSLSFYTIHVLILELLLKPNFVITDWGKQMWLVGIISALALTVITYAVICVCDRWRFTRGMVLGIWKTR